MTCQNLPNQLQRHSCYILNIKTIYIFSNNQENQNPLQVPALPAKHQYQLLQQSLKRSRKGTDIPLEAGCLQTLDPGEFTHDKRSHESTTNQLRKLKWIYSYLLVLSCAEMLIYNGPVANDPVMRVRVHVLVEMCACGYLMDN